MAEIAETAAASTCSSKSRISSAMIHGAFERNRSCALPFAIPETSYGCGRMKRTRNRQLGTTEF
ncbi:hypothetical protein X739_24280 [Mesorhizobium sp. LNHC220B00]|nr:hypothetical protein X739_24280 [Mesorhizobium sp. LNHC220B00]